MNTAASEPYDEPVKLKRVEAQPSRSSAAYWSPRIESLLERLNLRNSQTHESKPLEPES